ncbi:60 kDa SS-A/Ro ribonucleoprotein [Lamellibrachia satsuma]|nr:60 kDa SS-A/Ro ribonucleoprotein [Lamellibrachia satsuma]
MAMGPSSYVMEQGTSDTWLSGGLRSIITPQTEPLSERQVENHNGGYVYQVDDLVRLARLFCLGTEGGTYYIGDEQLKVENAQCITRLIESGRGNEVVNMAVEYSVTGRTSRQNGLMLAMAMCARQSVDPDTKKLCYEHLHEVCRIPTHLFMFLCYCEALSTGTGWGRAHRRAISKWYLGCRESPQEAKRLAMLVTKYKTRNGWSHQDVVRLAHPNTNQGINDNGVTAILKYIVKGFDASKKDLENSGLLEYIQAVEDVKAQRDPDTINVSGLADMIRQHHLMREHVNTQLLKFPDIWAALLECMPMTAMIRNLGKMSSIGMLTPGSSHEQKITTKLRDENNLKMARIHPFSILIASLTYKKGHNDLESLSWSPNKAILQVLDDVFYLTFKQVEPTNKRYLLAVDVSGSMYNGQVNGCNSITPGMAAAALSLITARTERQCEIVGFSQKMVPIGIGDHMKLPDVMSAMRTISADTGDVEIPAAEMSMTDCSLPLQYALQHKKKFDVFIVYTDNEPNCGYIHPAEELQEYRTWSGIADAKLIVCAMSITDFSIADPDDANVMNMPGFDTSSPKVMSTFIMDEMQPRPAN